MCMDNFVERAKNALTTKLPTPIHGQPLNELWFTTVPTAPTTTKTQHDKHIKKQKAVLIIQTFGL